MLHVELRQASGRSARRDSPCSDFVMDGRRQEQALLAVTARSMSSVEPMQNAETDLRPTRTDAEGRFAPGALWFPTGPGNTAERAVDESLVVRLAGRFRT